MTDFEHLKYYKQVSEKTFWAFWKDAKKMFVNINKYDDYFKISVNELGEETYWIFEDFWKKIK